MNKNPQDPIVEVKTACDVVSEVLIRQIKAKIIHDELEIAVANQFIQYNKIMYNEKNNYNACSGVSIIVKKILLSGSCKPVVAVPYLKKFIEISGVVDLSEMDTLSINPVLTHNPSVFVYIPAPTTDRVPMPAHISAPAYSPPRDNGAPAVVKNTVPCIKDPNCVRWNCTYVHTTAREKCECKKGDTTCKKWHIYQSRCFVWNCKGKCGLMHLNKMDVNNQEIMIIPPL